MIRKANHLRSRGTCWLCAVRQPMWGQPPPAVVAASNDAHRCGTPPFENRKGWGSLDIGNAGKEREVERGIVPRFGSLILECRRFRELHKKRASTSFADEFGTAEAVP